MSGKPSWVDYANLASNLAQNVQLSEVRSALNILGALQAEKVRLELNEQQRTEREDRLREGLWQTENAFNKLARDTAVTPCAMCIMTSSVQLSLERFGVTSKMFRQLADKDRLGSFQERLQKVFAETSAKLTVEQRADVENFFGFSVELEELRFLLERHEQAVKKTEAERQWVEAAKKLRQILGPLIPQNLATRMKALEQAMVTNDEEATRIFEGPEWDADGGDDKWSDALDRRDEAAAALRQMIYEACEKLRQRAASQPKKGGILSNVFAGSFRLPSPFKAVAPDILQEISSLERIMRESADLANSPSDSGGARGTEMAQKHGRDAESWKRKIVEHEAFMGRFSQSSGISPDDLLRYSADTSDSKSSREMSPEVQALARRADQKISAIQLYQKEAGVSLAEAKAAVEAFAVGDRDGLR
jgi:ribosomal protein L7/L12